MYLRSIRKYRNITLDKLGELTGMPKGNLSLVENGKLNLKLDKALKLAEILDCRITDLTGETKFDPNFKPNNFIQIPLFSDALKDKYEQGYFENRENKLLIQFDINILESSDIKDFDKDKLFYIKMVGDTMLPLISHDDNLLISSEVQKQTIRSNKLYLINENGKLSVKRIMRENPTSNNIIVKDGNESSVSYTMYETQIDKLPDDFLIGKVIYVGKRIY